MAKIPCVSDAATRLKALLIGDAMSALKLPGAPPLPGVKVNLFSVDGENVPKAKPELLRKKLIPTSLSTVLLISTTLTSTCTVPESGTVERSTTRPGLPSLLPLAAARAAACARAAA
ncbi:hypothetical protein D3C72_2216970 [compost metagenome]